jgi:hypothetical protein
VLSWTPRIGNVQMMNDAYDWYAREGERYRPQPHPILQLLDWLTPARVRTV